MNGDLSRLSWLVLLLFLSSACASAGARGGQTRYSHDLISVEEIQLTGPSDLLTVVQSLRPQWLQPRGVSSIYMRESVKVYLDNSLLGGPETLRHIATYTVVSVRYLDGVAASQRWGLDHGMGAIMVTTRTN